MIELMRLTEAARMFQEKGRLRLAIHGRSMTPSIVEPMVMQIGSAARTRVGDVLVFNDGRVNVAHRVVGRHRDGFWTAGDAQPHIVETVSRDRVVGRVVAIWSDDSPSATRVDGRLHRLRGWYFAVFQPIRCAVRRIDEKVRDMIERARPRHRARMTMRLIRGITAVQHLSAPAFAEALGDCDGEALEAIDRRHRCAAMFGEAARRFRVTEQLSPDVAAFVRRASLHAVIATERMLQAVNRTVEVLHSAGIEFALLKGAARVYADAPGSAYHTSDDVDVFVHAHDVDRAVEALRARGWTYRDTPREVRRFRAHHHHAASLFSPNGDFPVEVHHALAQPGTLSIDTTWDALRPHLVKLDGKAGPVLQFDAVGTALHLAVHSIGLTRLRDTALLAKLLPALRRDELAELARIIHSERRDPVRLCASVALAAQIARVSWQKRAGVVAYVRWALRREDLPTRLRIRSDAGETYFAHPNAPWSAARDLVPWWSRGKQLFAVPARIIGRCAVNVLAVAYATRMASPRNH